MIIIEWETTYCNRLMIEDSLAAELFGCPVDDIIGTIDDMDEEDVADKLIQFENWPNPKVERNVTDWKQE